MAPVDPDRMTRYGVLVKLYNSRMSMIESLEALNQSGLTISARRLAAALSIVELEIEQLRDDANTGRATPGN